jgi:hypothetical protein
MRIATDTAFKLGLEVPAAAVEEIIRLAQSNFENPLR